MIKKWNHKWFGYWNGTTISEAGMYSFEAWVNSDWTPFDKPKILEYLKYATIGQCLTSFGDLNCPFCGKNLGEKSAYHTDGAWLWPENLSHMISCHNLSLPDEFIDHIRSRNYKLPKEGDIDWSNLDRPNFDNIEE